ncbi:hypothetical protein KAX97_04675 [candidate division WOR-3 bacterium]|nr:hypothetical protein [candidate division WOR-3 bacterium]
MIRFFSATCSAVVIMLLCACGSAEDTEDSRPRVIDEPNNEVGFTNADYEQHVESLRKNVPQGFTVIIQKPFVVIGDESPDLVKLRAEKTIKWTVDMLKQDYFEKDPYDIINIWLFKDEKSYYKYAKDIFGDEPTTPFGYYSETEKALVMNISTGGGTLVHEIVHPFVRANFPECPAWFNEGLASLYEQCGEKNGHIYGYTNWRLKGLQTAIKQGLVPPFKNLFSMSEYEFYTQDKGTNYGQSRYLCYYLQEKGLLVKFFHEFYKYRKEDPTGYKTLKKILSEDDMSTFKEKWEEFVMKLTFP